MKACHKQDNTTFGLQSFNGLTFAHAFQPIVSTHEKSIFSQEVLVRGEHGELAGEIFSAVPPNDVYQFDQHSRECALQTASALGLDSRINLNFSPMSLLLDDGQFIDKTIAALDALGIEPKQLVVEITESEVIKCPESLAKRINQFRKIGAAIAIDDFGAGYAGLNMLVDIQPDYLKLDRKLVNDIHKNGPQQSIVRAVIEIGFDIGIDVIAEGVEKKEEFNFLNREGVNLFQGFLFARPGFLHFPSVSFLD